MSPDMTTLTKSQDKLGWRNLTHMAFGSSFFNGKDGVANSITKILQITPAQCVYCNFSINNKQTGYLRRKDMKEVMVEIETLLNTRPDEIPKDIHFVPRI
jgi:hypothetical protein